MYFSIFLTQIFGCKDVTVLAEDVKLNGKDYFVYNMVIKATVVEDGTAQEYHGEAKAEVQRTALNFVSVGKEEYLKPNLPFTGKVCFTDASVILAAVDSGHSEGSAKNLKII